MNKTVKTAVIGVGKMGAHHARLYAELDTSELVGVYDAHHEQAQQVAATYGVAAFNSLGDLQAAGVEAVSIAVPTSMHADVGRWALRQGLHVLMEKPIAATMEEARQLIETAHAYRRKLMVGHIERYNPAIQTIKAAVRPEDIIAINVVRVGPLPPRIKDAGVIIDLAVHDIDLVHYLTGAAVESVFAVSSATLAQHEDSASILLRLPGGAAAQITTNWITPYKAREIQVITADTLVRGNLITHQVQAFSRFSDQDQSYIVRDLFVRRHEPLSAQLEAFLRAVAFDGPVPITGEDGMAALAVATRAATFQPLPIKVITPLAGAA